MGKDRFDFSEIDAALPAAERMQEKDRLTVIQRQEDAPCLLMNTAYGRPCGPAPLPLQSCGQTICTVYERMEKGMWRD